MKKLMVFACVISLLAVGMVTGACPKADLTGDCKVNLEDFAVMASEWLVDWVPADPSTMVWISINDSGAGMKDKYGNPISHGGFIGEMSKYETTNAQYCQFLNEALASGDITVGADNIVYGADGSNNGADFVGEIYFKTYVATPISMSCQITYIGGIFSVRSRDGYDMSNHPVVQVSWYGATAFCNYYDYRLPTEWEWQAVADYDGSYTYGCGITIDQSKANAWDGDYANPLGLSSKPYTNPVNYYSSYGYEMNDMAGNVVEWTNSNYFSHARVFRGGDWADNSLLCSVSSRHSNTPDFTSYAIGFRVCLDVKEPLPILNGMTWVSIIDSGTGMKDWAGEPISHGGFIGDMGKYETTNAQYCQYLNAAFASGDITVGIDNSIVYNAKGATGSNDGDDFVGEIYYNFRGSGSTYNGAINGGAARINFNDNLFTVDSGFENHPVTYVSWHGATAFCNYYGYRLPTEWEWQAVADHQGEFVYGCGMSMNNSIANYYDSTHPDGTVSVGSLGDPLGYGYGMCDMAGNAMEWTESLYHSYRIIRGGSWNNYVNGCTVSDRGYDNPDGTGHFIGFRICR